MRLRPSVAISCIFTLKCKETVVSVCPPITETKQIFSSSKHGVMAWQGKECPRKSLKQEDGSDYDEGFYDCYFGPMSQPQTKSTSPMASQMISTMESQTINTTSFSIPATVSFVDKNANFKMMYPPKPQYYESPSIPRKCPIYQGLPGREQQSNVCDYGAGPSPFQRRQVMYIGSYQLSH